VIAHRTEAELAAALDQIRAAPRDAGTVELIVRRPVEGQREVLEEAELDLALGVVGDGWHVRPSSSMPDKSPHPGAQLALMSSRVIDALTGDRADWPIAGDQLYVDLDLAGDNLPTGTRLAAGATVVVEITDKPRTDCAKFTERFGSEASRWLNTPAGRELRLRGIHARVVVPGTVRRGDAIRKLG
jgi:hypothetical protein